MAKGKLGKTYEAVLYVALLHLKSKKTFSGDIFWNKKPTVIDVEPDFLLGNLIDSPHTVIMVSHGDSSKNSDMKCWRNINELAEVKTYISPDIRAINIIFDNGLKDDLIKMEDAAFDSQIVVRELGIGTSLREWADKHKEILPIDQIEKAKAISALYLVDANLKRMIDILELELSRCISQNNGALIQLWQQETERVPSPSRKRKVTFVRRGMTKRMLVGNSLTPKGFLKKDGMWLSKLGIAKATISGFQCIDEELNWLIDSPFSSSYKAIARNCMSASFKQQLIRVKSILLIDIYAQYVASNYASLITKQGMVDYLTKLQSNPSEGLDLPVGVLPPNNIWMYDFIAALSKAAANKAQAFGYSYFSLHPDGNKSKIGNMTLGRWCTSFSCEYFNRKEKLKIHPDVVPFIATVLSEQLSKFSPERIVELSEQITEKYITKEYNDVLLAHRGFDPLLAILLHEKVLPSKDNVMAIRTCFAEKAGLSGSSGKNTVAVIEHTLIKWQTAFANPRDKRKELCGRVVGLRYSWNEEAQSFIPRKGIQKMILLLDGTWEQCDLDALIKAGWDEIYYPDEIDQLKKAIV